MEQVVYLLANRDASNRDVSIWTVIDASVTDWIRYVKYISKDFLKEMLSKSKGRDCHCSEINSSITD